MTEAGVRSVRAGMVLALVLLVPCAAAQSSVPTALFVHLVNVQDAPINTQEPPEAWSTDASWGTAMTMRCLHGTTGDIAGTGFGTAGTTKQGFATWRGYGSPAQPQQARRGDGAPRRVRPPSCERRHDGAGNGQGGEPRIHGAASGWPPYDRGVNESSTALMPGAAH